jgi:hypothetical protein
METQNLLLLVDHFYPAQSVSTVASYLQQII